VPPKSGPVNKLTAQNFITKSNVEGRIFNSNNSTTWTFFHACIFILLFSFSTVFSENSKTVFEAESMESEIGFKVEDSSASGGVARVGLRVFAPKFERKALVFGPYTRVEKGVYIVHYRIAVGESKIDSKICMLDICHIDGKLLKTSHWRYFLFSLCGLCVFARARSFNSFFLAPSRKVRKEKINCALHPLG
jgi:hypothetical protein